MAINASRFPGVPGNTFRPDYEPGDSVDPRTEVALGNKLYRARKATAQTPPGSDWDVVGDFTPATEAQESAEADRIRAEQAANSAAQDKATVAGDRLVTTAAREVVVERAAEVAFAVEEAKDAVILTAADREAVALDRAGVSADREVVASDRVAAAAARQASTAAADRADLAAEAALAAGNIYSTVAAGEAATPAGKAFIVLATSDARVADVYLRTSGGSEYKKSTPSAAALAAVGQGAEVRDDLVDAMTFDDPWFNQAGAFAPEGDFTAASIDDMRALVDALAALVSGMGQTAGEVRDDLNLAVTFDDPWFNSGFSIDEAGGSSQTGLDSLTERVDDLEEDVAALQEGGGGGSADDDVIIPMDPRFAYGMLPNPIRLYQDGIAVHEAMDFAFEIPRSNRNVTVFSPARYIPQVNGQDDLSKKLQLPAVAYHRYKRDGTQIKMGEFVPIWLPAKEYLVSPTAAINVVCIGDSKTLGYPLGGFAGAYPNHFSYMLTGYGRTITTYDTVTYRPFSPSINQGGQPVVANPRTSRPHFGLDPNKIRFRGTLGRLPNDGDTGPTPPVMHEGRAAWSVATYVDVLTGGGKTNAFMNPATMEFDPAYYCRVNNFMANGALNANGLPCVDGVLEDFSNLVLWVWLAINDQKLGVPLATAKMAQMMDLTHKNAPGAKFQLMGLNGCPRLLDKDSTLDDGAGGSYAAGRITDQRTVFETTTRDMGLAYRALCDARSWCPEFLQISHQINPETAFPRRAVSSSDNTTLEVNVASYDYVHEWWGGGEAVAYMSALKFAHDYCLPL